MISVLGELLTDIPRSICIEGAVEIQVWGNVLTGLKTKADIHYVIKPTIEIALGINNRSPWYSSRVYPSYTLYPGTKQYKKWVDDPLEKLRKSR